MSFPYENGSMSLDPTQNNFLYYEDIVAPNVDESLTRRYGSELLTGFLEMAGATKVTTNRVFDHFEKDRLMPKLKATSTAASGAGAAATFTLDSAATYEVPQNNEPFPPTSSEVIDAIPVRVNDTVLIPPASGTSAWASLDHGIVVSVDKSQGTFEVRPLDGTVTLAARSSAVEVVITGNAFGESSGMNDSLDGTVTKYSNNTQIIKNTYDVSASAKSTKIFFTVNGKKYWSLEGERDAYYRFRNYKELTLLTSKKATNVSWYDTTAQQGEPNATTSGAIDQVYTNGNVETYVDGTGFQLSNLENIARNLDKNKGSKNNMFMYGFNLGLQIDELIRTDFNNGSLVFGSYKFSEAQKLNLRMSAIQVGGYTFNFKNFDSFNDAQTLGATGLNFSKEGIVMPMDNQVDAVSGEQVQAMRMRYTSEEGSKSRMIKKAMIDHFNTTQDGKDKYEVRYLADVGLEMFALNRWAYVTVSGS